MSLVKWTFIALIALPVAEVLAFMLVASVIGWFPAVVLFIATSALGLAVLKRSGLDHLVAFRQALARDGISAVHLETPGLAAIAGGILLVFPGFITDVLGLALLVPGLRRWLGPLVTGAIRTRRRKASEPDVIDLEPGQWHQIPDSSASDAPPRKRRPRAPRRSP